jgi:dolichyl-phosphate-mannose--protein O-mannosyl transferase
MGLTIFAALLRFPRLQTPAEMFFDEIYYAKAAQQVLAGQEVTEERTHPPLSKLIIAASIAVAGDRAFGWRLASALAGTLLVGATYALAAALFEDRFAAAGSAMLVALDGLVLVESRIAKPDIFLSLFLVVALAAFWRYLRMRLARGGLAGDAPGGGVRWLYVSGVAAGAALATKWTAAVVLASIPLTLALLWRRGQLAPARRDLWHLVAAFTGAPLAVYLLTYVPYFALGHGASDLVRHHVSMYEFHASLTEGHPYQSRWWSWPLLVRPIWYHYYEAAPQLYRGILAIGNPIIWWAGLPALAFVAVQAVRRRGVAETFLAVGFLVSYAPYALIPRALFLYHFLPALLFLIMALALVLARVRARIGSGVVLAYVALAAGWLVAYYPVLSALPIAASRYWRLMWFGSWI